MMKMMKPVLLTASLTALCLLPLANAGAAPKRLAFDVPDPDVKTWDVGTPIGQGRDANGAIINTLKYKVTAGTFSKENDPYLAVLPQGEADFHIDPLIQDFDHWQLGGASGDEADQVLEPPANLNYTWTATGGAFVGATSTHDAKWTAPTQDGLYEVTCTVEDKPLQPGVGETGTRDDEPLKLKFTVAVTHFSVALKVLQVKRATATAPETVGELTTGEIAAGKKHGGLCEAALELDMGPALHYVYPVGQPAPGGGTSGTDYRLRVEETTGHADNESAVEWVFSKTISSGTWDKETGGGWEKITDYYFDRVPRNTTDAMKWRVRQRWNSAQKTSLLGHNGLHKLSAIRSSSLGLGLSASRTGFEHTVEVVFPNGHRNGQTFKATPTDKTFDVHNVVITKCEAADHVFDANGNVTGTIYNKDYFKFNKESTDELRKHPQITFKIEDKGEMNRYEWFLWIKETKEQFGYIQLTGIMEQPDEKTVTINADRSAGQPTLDYAQSGPLTEWGTYTFELRVREIKTSDQLTAVTEDNQDLRSEQFFIPENYVVPGTESAEDGHDFWVDFNPDDDSQTFKAKYYLDDWAAINGTDFSITVVDGELNEKATVSRSPNVKVPSPEIALYTLTDDDTGGFWRGIFGGLDGHAYDYRDHKSKRMQVCNRGTGVPQAHLYDYLGKGADVAGAFYLGGHMWNAGTKVKGYATKALGAPPNSVVWKHLRNDSVWYWCGHGDAGEFDLNGVISAVPGLNPPGDSLSKHPFPLSLGPLPRVPMGPLLMVFHGCNTANTSDPVLGWGNLLTQATSMGASCALGFSESCAINPTGNHGAANNNISGFWSDRFFEALCWGKNRNHTAVNVKAAAEYARDEIKSVCPSGEAHSYDSFKTIPDPATIMVVPAR